MRKLFSGRCAAETVRGGLQAEKTFGRPPPKNNTFAFAPPEAAGDSR
jgi:hypothetical protein